MNEKMKYLTREILRRIRTNEPEENEYEYALSDEYIEDMHPNVKLPVTQATLHQQKGPHKIIRVICVLPTNGIGAVSNDQLGLG